LVGFRISSFSLFGKIIFVNASLLTKIPKSPRGVLILEYWNEDFKEISMKN